MLDNIIAHPLHGFKCVARGALSADFLKPPGMTGGHRSVTRVVPPRKRHTHPAARGFALLSMPDGPAPTPPVRTGPSVHPGTRLCCLPVSAVVEWPLDVISRRLSNVASRDRERPLHDHTKHATEIAREAGAILREGQRHPFAVDLKGKRDIVTSVDTESETLILKRIRERYPDDRIVAEESSPIAPGEGTGTCSRAWIVDPLDGTNNFARGYPFYCVAIAVEEAGELVAGIVYDPLRDELFAAERGEGATLNGERIRVSDTSLLSDSVVATGFPYDRSASTENNLGNLNRFILSVRGIRRAGSAELDLAYVACGRLDGFWELGLKIWDVSAGGLLVLEAGGTVSLMDGSVWDHSRGDIVASNGRIHAEMLAVLNTPEAGEDES